MKRDMHELELFPHEDLTPSVKRPKPGGGSGNPIVFHDYESYIAKFAEREKTTDDTYTPKDVYEAVLKYVGEVYDLSNKEILRPFYPGGDYKNAEYPEDGVVIDNPPFSIFTEICRWYSARHVPFFLFGPGLTISSCCKYCTAVVIDDQITFDNGAKVKCNFASNLFGDTLIMTAPRLNQLIMSCKSQDLKVKLPKYDYPEELLSVSDMQTICSGDIGFRVSRNEAVICRNLDNHPKSGGLFGDHFLLSKAKAKAKAKAKEEAARAIHISLSPREQRIVDRLDKANPVPYAATSLRRSVNPTPHNAPEIDDHFI